MAKRRRRWEEELEREPENAGPKLADLDTRQRASVLEELQRASGNRALQQVVGAQQLQREAAPAPTLSTAEDPRTFMYVDGIPGPTIEKKYAGAFEVEDYQLEMRAPHDAGSGLPTGKRQYSDLTVIIKKSGKTPAFRGALAENKEIKTIKFTGLEQTTLTGVRVVGIKDLPNGRVQLTFTFDNIEWTTAEETYTDAPHASPT